MTTSNDAAERAAVGVGTVSRVLNDRPFVRFEKRPLHRVLAVVDELDFDPRSISEVIPVKLVERNTTAVQEIGEFEDLLGTSPSCGRDATR